MVWVSETQPIAERSTLWKTRLPNIGSIFQASASQRVLEWTCNVLADTVHIRVSIFVSEYLHPTHKMAATIDDCSRAYLCVRVPHILDILIWFLRLILTSYLLLLCTYSIRAANNSGIAATSSFFNFNARVS